MGPALSPGASREFNPLCMLCRFALPARTAFGAGKLPLFEADMDESSLEGGADGCCCWLL